MIIRAHLCMLLWALLVASGFFAAAEVNPAVAAIPLTAVRLLLSALLFLPLLLRSPGGLPRGRALSGHALLGLLLAVYFGSLFEALKYTTALNTALLYLCVPLVSLGFEAQLLRESKVRARVLPMLTAASGALWLVLQKPVGADQGFDLYPLAIFAVGCLAMALYPPLSQWFERQGNSAPAPARNAFYNLLFGALFLSLLCLPDGSWRSLGQLQRGDFAWLGFLALFATLATFWLLHHAIDAIAPATVIAYSYLGSLFALLIQSALVHQLPGVGGWIGAALVLIGLLWLVRAPDGAARLDKAT